MKKLISKFKAQKRKNKVRQNNPDSGKKSYWQLIDSLHSDECPVCYALLHVQKKFIEDIFYESVNDPTIRHKFESSGGLCPIHSQLMFQQADKLGLAILARDLLQKALDQNFNLSFRKCFLCEHQELTEKYLIEDFISSLPLQNFTKELQISKGLCLKHFNLIFAAITNKKDKNFLLNWQKEKMKRLLQFLSEFIRKNDYRFKEEKITEEESKAIEQVWNLLTQ